MDYFAAPWIFRLRKALRYVGLYGFRRTYVRIAGQYHMRRKYAIPPRNYRAITPHARVGLIGCGFFGFSFIAHYLSKNFGRVIRGCMDVDSNHAASLCDYYKAAYYTTDAEELCADPSIDVVFIASNHATHAEYAIQALKRGKDVHIEKPHVVRTEQLHRLCDAMNQGKGRILSIGYNRTQSPFGVRIRETLAREEGELMQSWFIAGHQIAGDHWYYSEPEGGRVLGNLCHWIDFVYQMMPPEQRFPIVINPTRSQKSDCDIAVTYTFGDGSIAALTFSAKGHAFEGVKERYAAHRGDALISMDNFQVLRIDKREHRQIQSLWKRDHGHDVSIRSSYVLSKNSRAAGIPVQYVSEMGRLILDTKKALDTSQVIIVEGFKQ